MRFLIFLFNRFNSYWRNFPKSSLTSLAICFGSASSCPHKRIPQSIWRRNPLRWHQRRGVRHHLFDHQHNSIRNLSQYRCCSFPTLWIVASKAFTFWSHLQSCGDPFFKKGKRKWGSNFEWFANAGISSGKSLGALESVINFEMLILTPY